MGLVLVFFLFFHAIVEGVYADTRVFKWRDLIAAVQTKTSANSSASRSDLLGDTDLQCLLQGLTVIGPSKPSLLRSASHQNVFRELCVAKGGTGRFFPRASEK